MGCSQLQGEKNPGNASYLILWAPPNIFDQILDDMTGFIPAALMIFFYSPKCVLSTTISSFTSALHVFLALKYQAIFNMQLIN